MSDLVSREEAAAICAEVAHIFPLTNSARYEMFRARDAIRALPAVQPDAAAIREEALREIAESLLSLGDNLTYIAAATEAHLHSEAYALRANVLALIDKLGKESKSE